MSLPEPLSRSKPVFAAPMAGGPSTPALVIAAARAGHFAQLAAGYKAVDALRTDIGAVREAGVDLFGVNLFVPNIHRIDDAAYARYWERIAPSGTSMPAKTEDDDAWGAKVELLLADPVPAVSFTFGLPERTVIDAFRDAGTLVLQTVTSAAEARSAIDARIDVLVVQGYGAGGHSGVWEAGVLPAAVPLVDLVRGTREAVAAPIVATGAVSRRDQVAELLDGGADAVAVGTALLRARESGTSSVHRSALADPAFARTELTRAFTGRPARALVNRFAEAHSAHAPSGYPAIHHLTRAMRADAAARGDSGGVHLWAGEGWRDAREAPAAEILRDLTP
ncbi:nitronate monooxygenase [Microbacterium sp. MEC084]|uniref:nitronate monooxygenase n=1 Tax=Microbacterium sp. MEC084 TaxID=1963027 RepID=UPI00106F484C|nr:nitronate monooxygenase [Microbacterium sp. MEC084]MCD1268787.1 nitronate monooxygenase [Microbacterium sp. MEC084]